MPFLDNIDIANRTCQLLGIPHIGHPLEHTDANFHIAFAYDKLRRAELRRNAWRFATRRAALRPLSATTKFIVPPQWSPIVNYPPGSIVADANNLLWLTTADSNLGNQPGNSALWDGYFGPLTVDLWNATSPLSQSPLGYYAGELVYKTPGDGTYTIYLSLLEGNTDDPQAVDAWSATVSYLQGQIASFGGINYQSLVGLNYGNEPDTSPTQWTTTITVPAVSNSWQMLSAGMLTNVAIVYPLEAGPVEQAETRNAYRLPSGFLREAAPDPKRGNIPWLGTPSGRPLDDWTFEGNYIVSAFRSPIILRFIADIQLVTDMDDMFAEGLASRIAVEVLPEFRDSQAKAADLLRGYHRVMGEARIVNAIESGPVEMPLDLYIAVRY